MTKLLAERNLEKEFQKSNFILDVTEEICKILSEKNITRQELADRLGKSKGFVSQILNGSRNMTLNTLADVCIALGCTPKVKISDEIQKSKDNVVYLVESFPINKSKPCNYNMDVAI